MVTVGIHQQYQGTVDRTTPAATLAEYPLTKATREFNANPIDPQNLIPKVENVCRQVWDKDLIAVWSFKPKPADVKAGKWKPYIEQLISYLKTNELSNKFILVIWHEPENDIPKWFSKPEDFVTVFNTIHDLVKSVDPSVLTSHAALGYRYGDKNMGTSSNPQIVPIDIDDATAKRWRTKADIHTLDLYQGRSWPLAQILPENSGYQRWMRALVGGLTVPWGLSERGFIADPSKPAALAERVATIKREADWFFSLPEAQKPILLLLWDTIGTEGDEFIPIRDELGKNAVRYYMRRVQEAPTEEPQPEPDPVQTIECPLCHGSSKVSASQTYTIVKVV